MSLAFKEAFGSREFILYIAMSLDGYLQFNLGYKKSVSNVIGFTYKYCILNKENIWR